MRKLWRGSELGDALYERQDDLEDRVDELEQRLECLTTELTEAKQQWGIASAALQAIMEGFASKDDPQHPRHPQEEEASWRYPRW